MKPRFNFSARKNERDVNLFLNKNTLFLKYENFIVNLCRIMRIHQAGYCIRA